MPDRVCHLAARYPRATFIVWGVAALAVAVMSTGLRTAHNPEEFLPADSPARRALEEHASRTGAGTFVALGYEARDVLDASSLAAVGALQDALAALPGVTDVQSLPGALGNRGAIPESMRVTLAIQPDLAENLLTPDRQAAALWVSMTGPEVLSAVEQTVASHPDVTIVHMAGSAVFAETFNDVLLRDLVRVGLPLTVLLALAMFAAFRRWQAVAGTLAVIGLGLLGAMIPLVAMGKPLTILNLVALPLVAMAGLATAVHWMWAWTRTGGDATRATSEVAAPCAWAALTTAAAMASLMLTDFPALRAMGISAAAGVLVTLPAALTLLPATMAFSPPTVPAAPRLGVSLLPSVRPHSRRVVWGITAALVAVALMGFPRLRVESNVALALSDDLPLRRAEAWFEPSLGGMIPLEVVAQGQGAATSPMADETLTLLRSMPGLSTLRRPDGDDIFRATVRFPEMPSAEMEKQIALLYARLREIWPSEYQVDLTGEVPLILGAMASMLRGLGLSLLAALLIIFAIMAMSLRSLRWGALSIIPNALPILGALGLMGWFKRPVDLATTSVGCAALGVAVDDTIHVLHRHRWRAKGGIDRWALHRQIVQEVGPALLLTTLISVLCLTSLVLASFEPLRWFGLWAAVALGLALVADIHLLPTLLPEEKSR